MSECEEMLERFFVDKISKPFDDLFVATIDHSPSEQLSDDPWHTSAMIVCNCAGDQELAMWIANKVRPRIGTLRKWSGSRPAYRQGFKSALQEGLKDLEVFVLAYSRNREWIVRNTSGYLEWLKERGLYGPSEEGTNWVRFGPFAEDGGPPQYIHLQEIRAIMAIDIMLYVTRVYQSMRQTKICGHEHLRWQLFTDKFPGDGRMEDLFSVLLSIVNRPNGNIRITRFIESDSAPTDLLADNIAGMLNGILLNGKEEEFSQSDLDIKGAVYWEVFEAFQNEE